MEKRAFVLSIIGFFVLLILACIFIPKGYLSTETQTIILLETGIVLLWYTWETHKLRKEAQRQTEAQQRPFVILEPTQRTHSGDLIGLRLKNIGNGAAINIGVGNDSDSAVIPFLAKEETCLLRVQTTFHQRKPPTLALVDYEYNLFLDPTSARDTTVLMIQFKNVQMQSYFVEERMTASGLAILRSGKVEDHDM